MKLIPKTELELKVIFTASCVESVARSGRRTLYVWR